MNHERLSPPKALIAGFFSTVGDIECLNIVRRWLNGLHFPYDVAPYRDYVRHGMPETLDPLGVDAKDYTHLIVVCGPCWNNFFEKGALNLNEFGHCVRIGVNLTMIAPLEEWNPFDALFERDSTRTNKPDLTFIGTPTEIPVVGRCLVQQQKEYGSRQQLDVAIQIINDFIASREFGIVDIDTHWRRNIGNGKQPTPAGVLSVMKRMDFVLTNRLHGMVFALRAGVPVVAIDGIEGGDKLSAQARTIGWPMFTLAENATPDWMEKAANWCRTPEARETARACRERAQHILQLVEDEFLAAMTRSITPSPLPHVSVAEPDPLPRSILNFIPRVRRTRQNEKGNR